MSVPRMMQACMTQSVCLSVCATGLAASDKRV